EINEVISGGSGMDLLNQGDPVTGRVIAPADLFRYSAAGVRSFDTNLSTNSYFSLDGGTTNLVNFNQDANRDFGDWKSTPGVPRPQDAFATGNTFESLGVELRRLDVVGFTRVAPVALSITPPASQSFTPNVGQAFNLGSISNGNGPFTIMVNWGDG